MCPSRRHDVQLTRVYGRGGTSPASRTRKRRKVASAAPKTKRNKSSACFHFSETQRCSFGDRCKFSYEKPAATESRVPAGGGARGQRGDGIAGAGGQGGERVANALVVLVAGGGTVLGLRTGHRKVGADAAIPALDRGAGSAPW